MKQEGVPDVDVTKAVAELKARKRTLEAKVGHYSKTMHLLLNAFNSILSQAWLHVGEK